MVREISPARIEATIRKLVSFHTRHTLSETESDTRGIGAARRYIASELQRASQEAGGRLVVALDEFVQPAAPPDIPKPTAVVNVVASLPGRQPAAKDRLYVVTGHYDSRATNRNDATGFAPGANDDASGTAVVMELARVMAKLELDATVVFIAVAGEEQGMWGSTHWAKAAKEKGLDVRGMFSNDIVGSSTGADGVRRAGTLRLFADGNPPGEDGPPRALARAIVDAAERYVPDMNVTLVWRRDRVLRGSDHLPFLDQGWPAVRFTEASEDYRHQHQDVRIEGGVQYGDLLDFVDFAYVAQVARVNAAALATLALAPAPPEDAALEAQLGQDTTLRWKPNAEPDVAGYRIVWRETTAPRWQHARDVGNVTRATLGGVSKDDFFFGVQAVDREGHASVAATPKIVR